MTKEEMARRIEALSEDELTALYALIESLIKNRPPAEAPQETANPVER